MNKPDLKKLTFFKRWTLENFPFIEADFDAITNYQLYCEIVKYLNDVIANQKEIEKTNNEIINSMIALQEYVDNYFESLDIQEEVDNKLDEMVEDGTLEQIISQYITSNVTRTYSTFEEAMNDSSNLENGMKIKTLGFYSLNDGGAGEYYITDTASENELQIELADDLYATLIYDGIIYVKQYGCHCNNTDDDTIKLQELLDYIGSKVNFYGNNIIILDGQNQLMKITSTLKCKFQLKLQNFHINFYNGEYTQNYGFIINANDSLTILQQYPREHIGYMKNCIFNNLSNLDLNGIYNASNNKFSDLSLTGFDIFFRTSNDYLDSWYLDRVHLADKIESNNYGVICGMLGDSCGLRNCHFNINGKAVNVGSAHNGFNIENLICHGDILIESSNVTINNIHTEAGRIICNESKLKITNGFLYHENNHIELNNTNAILENIVFVYRQDLYSFEDINDIDIYTNDNKSNFEIKNCFKKVLEPNNQIPLTTIAQAHVKCNRENVTCSSYKKFNGNIRIKSHDIQTVGTVFSSLTRYSKWFGGTHDYYFRIIPMIDIERLIANLTYENNFNYSFNENENGWGALSVNYNTLWRIYRGSANNNYNAYCDVAHNDGRLADNGFMVNGNKWQSRTAGAIENMNQIVSGTVAKYDSNDNIIVNLSSTPSYGTWKEGDIVITSTKIYRCSVAGTPGTWVEI